MVTVVGTLKHANDSIVNIDWQHRRVELFYGLCLPTWDSTAAIFGF